MKNELTIDRIREIKRIPKCNANDPRVIVNGRRLPIEFRILSEENYQLFLCLIDKQEGSVPSFEQLKTDFKENPMAASFKYGEHQELQKELLNRRAAITYPMVAELRQLLSACQQCANAGDFPSAQTLNRMDWILNRCNEIEREGVGGQNTNA